MRLLQMLPGELQQHMSEGGAVKLRNAELTEGVEVLQHQTAPGRENSLLVGTSMVTSFGGFLTMGIEPVSDDAIEEEVGAFL